MKNKILFFYIFSLSFFTLFGQEKPLWFNPDARNLQFPNAVYLTGFAAGDDVEQVKLSAQQALLENLRVVINSKTTSEMKTVSHNDTYDEYALFKSSAEKSTEAEIAGMNVESYIDKKTNHVYAFAYVNKYDLAGYYKANLALQLQQVQSLLNTAEQVENSGEKAKARRLCKEAMPILAKIRSIQDLLIALDNTSANVLKVTETEQVQSACTQMQARLAQAILVCVVDKEDLFGHKVDIVANKVKAELAVSACSFVDNSNDADFHLKINVTTRATGSMGNMVICYADVAVELFDNQKQKTVYSDEIAQKGGSDSRDKAGRKAMSDAAPKIAEKLKNWLQ